MINDYAGMSDPHVRIFNKRLYLYCGNDEHPDDRIWVMRHWDVYSSDNLVDWIHEALISPADNYMGAGNSDCWAGDAAERNGKYYFYFSDQKRSVGVMQADSPTGPFRDALGKPLVAPLHDPTVFVDDDTAHTPYLLWGDKSDAYFLARLNEDMISLAEAPRSVTIKGEEWENAPEWMDKSYLFKRNGVYYLSWGRDYAIADNPYGPYRCASALGHGHALNTYAHGSFFEWHGQFYHIWCYYLREGYKYRKTVISFCHSTEDGRLHTDTKYLDAHFETGVGRYDAAWEQIRAVWFYGKTPELRKTGIPGTDRFAVRGFEDGSYLHFANFDFRSEPQRCTAKVSGMPVGTKLELRTGGVHGPVAGVLQPGNGTSTDAVSELACPVSGLNSISDLYLTYVGPEKPSFSLEYFSFSKFRK